MTFSTIAAASRRISGRTVEEPVAAYNLTILSPTEGQEVTGDLNIQLEVQASVLRIVTPAEGAEITGDLNIQLELE